VIGIGEQHPEMFSDQRWVDLASPYVRYVGSRDAPTSLERRWPGFVDEA
jgi:hypothetical protein